MKKLLALCGVFLLLWKASANADGGYTFFDSPSVMLHSQGVLGTLRGANFNTTADQPILITPGVSAFSITQIIVTNCSASLTLAAGGFYPAASKSGTPMVAATQLYSAATGSTIIVPTTIVATPLVTRYTLATVYLSLTTVQGAAATCDVYVIGVDLT